MVGETEGGEVKTYEVFFEQVNRTMYEVKASGREAAINKAAKDWRAEYGKYPTVSAVQNKETKS